MKQTVWGALSVGLLCAGCADLPQFGDALGVGYDDATLERYIAALPDTEAVLAEEPSVQTPTSALSSGQPAVFARHGIDFTRAVNQPAIELTSLLRVLTRLPPSRFDEVERQFTWGPWAHPNGTGYLTLWVRENVGSSAFQYSYALVRSPGRESGDGTSVIVGGASLNGTVSAAGLGVTLWDLDANLEFELAQDPGVELRQFGAGRYAMLYGHSDSNRTQSHFNIATFRDFAPPDTGGGPVERHTVDYFYGRFRNDSGLIHFVDSDLTGDFCDAEPARCFESNEVEDASERYRYQAAYVRGDGGRAEVLVRDGDLSEPVGMTECWNERLTRTSLEVNKQQATTETVPGGACAGVAAQPLEQLGVPTLDDVDVEILRHLGCLAERGLVGCSG